MAFRNFTDAISRLSITSVVLVCSHAWVNSSGTAVMRPNAVQFIATDHIELTEHPAFVDGLLFSLLEQPR